MAEETLNSEEAGFQFQKEEEMTSPEAGFQFESTKTDKPFPLDPSQLTYEDYERRSEHLRKEEQRREQVVKEAVESQGGKYSPDDFGDFWTETKISALESFDEKERAFLREYPKGDLMVVPAQGEHYLYGRPNATSAYQRVGGLPESAAAAAPETVGAVVGGLPGRAVRGIVGAGAGAAAGKVAKEEYLRSQGLLDKSRSEMFGESFGLGMAESALEGTMRGIGFLGKVGASIRPGDTLGREMSEFVSQEGLKDPAIGQVSESPVVRQMFTQTSGTSAVPGKMTTEQQLKLLDSFNKKVDFEELRQFSGEEINRVLSASTRSLNKIVKRGNLDRRKAGKDLIKGIEAFRTSSREWVNRKYERAFAAAEKGPGKIKFDISNAQQAFKDVFDDVRGRSKTKRDEMGRFKTDEIQINSLDDLPKELRNSVEKLMELNPTLSGYKGKNGFEQAKALRTRFFDLKQSDDPQTSRIAGKIYSALTDSMKRPYNADKEFANKFVAASKANAFRENILEDAAVVQNVTKNSNPTDIANKYFKADRREELRLLKRIVPKERWNSFKSEFINELVREPNSISTKLNKFDSKTLDNILTKEEQSAIRVFEEQSKLVDESMLKKISRSAESNEEKALQMVREADVDEINRMVNLSGGKSSAFARSLKEGIYYDVLKHSRETVDGRELISPSRMKERIRWWKNQGKLSNIMSKNDWDKLDKYEKYASMVQHGSADVGGQIRAAGLASDVRKFWKPWAQFGAATTLASDAATARLLTRHWDDLKKIPATDKMDSSKLRGAARATTALALSMQSPGDPGRMTENQFQIMSEQKREKQ